MIRWHLSGSRRGTLDNIKRARGGPQISALYRTHDANFSAWTVGQRLFGEAGFNFVMTPLWSAPLLAKALNLLVPLLILNAGLIVLGAYLIFHAIRRIHHYDRLIREIKRKHSAIAEFID